MTLKLSSFRLLIILMHSSQHTTELCGVSVHCAELRGRYCLSDSTVVEGEHSKSNLWSPEVSLGQVLWQKPADGLSVCTSTCSMCSSLSKSQEVGNR